jgi:hypothetical protein
MAGWFLLFDFTRSVFCITPMIKFALFAGVGDPRFEIVIGLGL